MKTIAAAGLTVATCSLGANLRPTGKPKTDAGIQLGIGLLALALGCFAVKDGMGRDVLVGIGVAMTAVGGVSAYHAWR
jgi:hypothetical protein